MKPSSAPFALALSFFITEGAVYAAFLTLDLLGLSRHALWLRYAGILLCPAFALRTGSRLTAAAQLLTAFADWFLLIRNDRYILGTLLFICVQALYALRLTRAGAGAAQRLRLLLAAVCLCVLHMAGLSTPLNALAAVYFSQLLANTVLAWRLPRMRFFPLGLTCMTCCDICVGLCNLPSVVPVCSPAAFIGIWLFYLPSQVLIALSAKEV